MVSHADKFHHRRDVSNARARTNGDPIPTRAVGCPATVVRGCPAPALVADPRPAPRILPEPTSVTERYPACGNARGRPGITVIGNLLPATVVRKIFDADNIVAGISIGVGVATLVTIVTFRCPSVECVGPGQSNDFISGRVDAVYPHFTVFDRYLSTASRYHHSAAAHGDPTVAIFVDGDPIGARLVQSHRYVGSGDLYNFVGLQTLDVERCRAFTEIELLDVVP